MHGVQLLGKSFGVRICKTYRNTSYSGGLANSKGHTCDVAENKLVLLAMNLVLEWQLDLVDADVKPINEANSTLIDELMAAKMK